MMIIIITINNNNNDDNNVNDKSRRQSDKKTIAKYENLSYIMKVSPVRYQELVIWLPTSGPDIAHYKSTKEIKQINKIAFNEIHKSTFRKFI